MQILVAKITSPHGIKGYVKLISYLENSYDLEKYNLIFAKDTKNYKIKLIKNIKQNIYIAKINNISDRNGAEEVRNTDLFIDKKELKQTLENQFYYHDLLNMKVKNISDDDVGSIVNIMNFGAGDLFEVKFCNDNYNKQMNIFPFSDDIINEINLEKGYIVIKEMNIL
tara:strand:+ start:13819 stop:14322 length:504 start_codon:yes stop_codon:yes gene_type:complete